MTVLIRSGEGSPVSFPGRGEVVGSCSWCGRFDPLTRFGKPRPVTGVRGDGWFTAAFTGSGCPSPRAAGEGSGSSAPDSACGTAAMETADGGGAGASGGTSGVLADPLPLAAATGS
ncbi:MAG: hypothetical protein ACRDPK_02765 [Carbonactinosporaceae bacterium]